jgi:hypothetical protein
MRVRSVQAVCVAGALLGACASAIAGTAAGSPTTSHTVKWIDLQAGDCVADKDCNAGFAPYTGRSIDGSPFTIAFLIDSNQDRTGANPTPSTVICLLQSANGQPLTGSARH